MKLALGLALLLAGCGTTREITISARPPDANVLIDGENRGRGPITESLKFSGDDSVHNVTARRLGYAEQTVRLTSDYERPTLKIALNPRPKHVTFTVGPVPAIVSIDGKPLTTGPVQQISTDFAFTLDEHGTWSTHAVTARRDGWNPAGLTISWPDADPNYLLKLGELKKDLRITTTPETTQVFINDQPLGQSPINCAAFPFPSSTDTNNPIPRRLKVVKPGYDPVETVIGWDEGKTDYHIELLPHLKTVRIVTDPSGATVKLNGTELARDPSGASLAKLLFLPVNEKGDLKAYEGQATKKTADSEWVPQPFSIAWDGGKTQYDIALKEIKTRPVTLLRMKPVRSDDGWQMTAEQVATLAMKDVLEGPDATPPQRIGDLPKGTMLDSLAVSPDGSHIVYVTLVNKGTNDLRSRMRMIKSDASAGETMFGDDRSLDIQPSFTADGKQIVFASNRAGRHMRIWQMSSTGEPGITQFPGEEGESDLWPNVDSDARPRLFYEVLLDSRPEPRLYVTVLGTTAKTDLTQSGGIQPRISPTADGLLFTAVNEKTGKRQIFKMPDKGGQPVSLTNDVDSDEFDPVWSKDGTKIAYVSDRGVSPETKNNYDIWVIDTAHPEKPIQVTKNGSWDDNPCWDPSGKYIYFRSNRGGDWGIWKIAMNGR